MKNIENTNCEMKDGTECNMEIVWNEEHGLIFDGIIKQLEAYNIRYFILRNYKGLPNENTAKDVDIIFEPGYLQDIRTIIVKVFKNNSVEYYKEEIYGHVHSFWGNNLSNRFSIHIDLIEGYFAKGFEVFSFDELYRETVCYNNYVVLNSFFSGVMLYVYKQFGYKHPVFKEEYKKEIVKICNMYPEKFKGAIAKITNFQFAEKAITSIRNNDFDQIIGDSQEFSKLVKRYVIKKRFLSVLRFNFEFWVQRVNQTIFNYKKFSNNFAVLAPDGTGKTTFLELVVEQLNYYRVCRVEDNHFSIYHFRPNIFPNLGEVGEKVGIKEQDKNFTDPHRNKPAGKISSFIRLLYYICDYILGWQIRVREDVRRNRWSIFDRYSYDLIVDPLRTRLDLPQKVREFFVTLTPKPNVIFCLVADENIVYARKQELKKEEIRRQLDKYKKIASKDERIIILNAERTPEEIADEAIKVLFLRYMKKI